MSFLPPNYAIRSLSCSDISSPSAFSLVSAFETFPTTFTAYFPAIFEQGTSSTHIRKPVTMQPIPGWITPVPLIYQEIQVDQFVFRISVRSEMFESCNENNTASNLPPTPDHYSHKIDHELWIFADDITLL